MTGVEGMYGYHTSQYHTKPAGLSLTDVTPTVLLIIKSNQRICSISMSKQRTKGKAPQPQDVFLGRTFSLEHLSFSGKEASSNLTQLSTSANDKVDT